MDTSAVPPLWIDGYAFGRRVLRGGEEPWKAPDELGLFLRELSQLLSLGLVEVPVAPAILAWVELQGLAPASLDAAGVERLLADAGFRAHLKRGIDTAAGALGGRSFALSLPGSGALATLFMDEDKIDEDMLDELSLSLAELLRTLYRSEVTVFRFTESDPRALDFLAPLTNLVRHYEAVSALVLVGDAVETAEDATGFDIVYGADGAVLDAAIWEGASAALPADHKAFAEIPSDMIPETVLARLSELDGQAA